MHTNLPKLGLSITALMLAAVCLPELTQAATAQTPNLEEYYRLPGHADSWSALAIILVSALIAFTLNHAEPHVRTAGTLLAALGCLGVFVWFLWVLGTGFIESGRTPVLPPAAAGRPTIMWAIGLLSPVAAGFLFWASVRQGRRSDQLALTATNSEERFGRVSRYLHWTTGILFISLMPMGFFTSMIPEGVPWRQGYYVAHKTIGFVVLLLVFVRLAWHLKSPTPALESSLNSWERRLARCTHILLYVLMIAMPITGFIMSTYGGKWSHFFIWDLPLLWDQDMEAIKPFGMLHKLILPYLCFLVLGAHLLGALKHHFIDKHPESIRRMVS